MAAVEELILGHVREEDVIDDGDIAEYSIPQYPPSPWSGPRMTGVEPDGDEPEAPEPPGSHRSAASAATAPEERVLGAVAVAMISFFNVSGGPIGSEEVVGSAGPLVGIGVLVLVWLLVAVPQGLITAELSSAFPQNGGYSIWVEAAFGRFWGVQESYWSWCSGVVDNALYPVLLYSTVAALLGEDWDKKPPGNDGGDGEDLPDLWICISTWNCARAYMVKLAITVVFTLPNLFSVNLVGQGLQAMCALVLAPYMLLCAIAFSGAEPARWIERPPLAEIDWQALISVIYWNVTGWDCASTFAGEVRDPGRTYPRGLALGQLLMLAAYAVPLLAASGNPAAGDWRTWRDGSFAQIGVNVGGHWLGLLIVASSALGNWGLFASELLEDSYQLLGMAEVGMAPRFFRRRHHRYHTPQNAILFQLAIISVLIGFDFNTILLVDNFFSATQAVLEFAAAVKLRCTHAHLDRPFRVPVPTWGLACLLLCSTLLSAGTAVACLCTSALSAMVTGLACLGGVAVYVTLQTKCKCKHLALSKLTTSPSVRSSRSSSRAFGLPRAFDDPSSLRDRLLDINDPRVHLAVPVETGYRPRDSGDADSSGYESPDPGGLTFLLPPAMSMPKEAGSREGTDGRGDGNGNGTYQCEGAANVAEHGGDSTFRGSGSSTSADGRPRIAQGDGNASMM